jgi:hypothetical protein
MAKKNYQKSASELRAENRLLKRFGVGQNVTKITVVGIKYGVIAAIMIKAFGATIEVARAFAGRKTVADVNVDVGLAADVGFDVTLPLQTVILVGVFALLVALVGVTYGLRQAKLRKDLIEKLAPYRRMYELSHDPNRSSSRLSSRGDEPKESDRSEVAPVGGRGPTGDTHG